MNKTTADGRPVINMDLDNVVYDFSGAMRRYAEEVLERELPASNSWKTWEDWGIPKGAWMNLFRRGVEYGRIWLTGDPEPGAIEGLWALSDAEYYIRLLTHRLNHPFGHRLAVQHTVQWLDEHSIPYRSIAFVGNEPKTNYEAKILVDDNAQNATEYHEAYGRAVLLRKPWNNMVSPKPGLFVAQGWPSIVEHIMEVI